MIRVRLVITVALMVGAVLLVRWLVLSPYVVRSASMSPTLSRGDVVVVDKLTHRLTGLSRNDLVVFRRGGHLVLKRVVAVSGDVVVIHDAVLLVNDRRVREPAVDRRTVDGTYTARTTVPPGQVYVLGDRRERSIDSRHYGPIPISHVAGRVLLHW